MCLRVHVRACGARGSLLSRGLWELGVWLPPCSGVAPNLYRQSRRGYAGGDLSCAPRKELSPALRGEHCHRRTLSGRGEE